MSYPDLAHGEKFTPDITKTVQALLRRNRQQRKISIGLLSGWVFFFGGGTADASLLEESRQNDEVIKPMVGCYYLPPVWWHSL